MKFFKKVSLFLNFFCFFAPFFYFLNATAAQNFQVNFTKYTFSLKDDYTYTSIEEKLSTVLTSIGISQLQNHTYDFYPTSQKLEVVEAYVIHADGTKILVTPENIFTRPSAASQSAPGFVGSLTTTVVFPQLRIGSRTYVKWKLSQFKPSVTEFSQVFSPPFEPGIKDLQILLTLPKTLKLNWKEKGGFVVQDTTQGDTRTIKAEIKNVPPHLPEPNMPNYWDVSPLFIVSNIASWEELATYFSIEDKNTNNVTPQIQELSHQIVQGKKGRGAAEAIYNWITQNIQYIAVQLDPQQGWIPHTAAEILKNGYGDCKDHIALMQALLKVQNIESFPVFVDWGDLYTLLPLPSTHQFNHTIIYLPQFNLFANPTDQFASFGILGKKLEGKFALIIAPKGKAVYLPSSTPQQNINKNSNAISILSDGTIKGNNVITSTGYATEEIRSVFSSNMPLQEAAEQLLDETEYGGYGNLTLSSSPFDLSKEFTVQGTWTSPSSFSMEKTVYFLVPTGLTSINPYDIRQVIVPHTRLFPFITTPVQITSSYEIKIPKDYSVAHLPSNIIIESPEGSYKSTYSKKGKNTVFVERTLTVNKSYFSAQEYVSLRSILYKFESDVRSILVMEKKK